MSVNVLLGRYLTNCLADRVVCYPSLDPLEQLRARAETT